jgi:AraC-like DNA-binding protein
MDEVPSSVPSAVFDASSDVGESRREHYAAHMSGSWKAELLDEGAGHVIEARSWDLGGMVVTLNDFPARRVARSQAMTRSDQLDHYYVQLPLAIGGMRLDVDGNPIASPVGAPILMDLSRPFDTYHGAGRLITAFMPREVFDELLPSPRDVHGMRLQGAAAGMLADLLQSLTERLPTMSAGEAASVAKGTMHLVAASLTPTSDTLERARPAIESSLLRQACRYIELHLKDADLGTLPICAAMKISRATLYRLFESYGGVANHIKERRLIRIHGLLTAPDQRRSLALIADDHGFKDASHFSRAFRRHFGYTPSEAPAHQVIGASPPSAAGESYGESLAEWLQPLRG